MTDANRRPLTSRDTRWAKALAARLVASNVTPNQISQASVGFAALGFLLFWAVSRQHRHPASALPDPCRGHRAGCAFSAT
jgi:hypothetical protein